MSDLVTALNHNIGSILLVLIVFMLSVALSRLQDEQNGTMKAILIRCLYILPPAILVACRGCGTGADTVNFYALYYYCDGNLIENVDFTGVLYFIIQYYTHQWMGANPILFFFIIAFIPLYCVALLAEKACPNRIQLSLFVFYLFWGLQLMNQSRQMVAVGILAQGFLYLKEKNMKTFVLCTVLASTFHLTALFASLIYLVIYLFRDKRYLLVGIFVGTFWVAINFSAFFGQLGALLGDLKYVDYLENENYSLGLGLVIVILPILSPLFLIKDKTEEGLQFRFLLSYVFPIRLAAYTVYFVYRMLYYFGVFTMVYFPMIVDISKNKKMAKGVVIFMSVFYFVVYYCWTAAPNYFPYVPFEYFTWK